MSATNANLKLEFPEVLKIQSVKYDGDLSGILQDGNGTNTIDAKLPILPTNNTININMFILILIVFSLSLLIDFEALRASFHFR